MAMDLTNIPMRDGKSTELSTELVVGPVPYRVERPSRTRFGLALGVAAVSDVLSFAIDFILPLQWALDLATAILLFLILGRRWALLPGLIAEAIPGIGVFPVWFLVVISLIAYDDIKARRR
jgi:hypothetical protein